MMAMIERSNFMMNLLGRPRMTIFHCLVALLVIEMQCASSTGSFEANAEYKDVLVCVTDNSFPVTGR